MKELTSTQVTHNLSLLRRELKNGPVRIVWREPKPGGKIIYSAIVNREDIKG